MRKEFWKYITAVLIFGTNGIVASKIALSSQEIVFFRAGIAGVILIALFLLLRTKGDALQYKREFGFLAIAGAATGANWLLLYEAFQQVGVGTGTLLCYCGTVIVMALGPILFQEKLTWKKCIGFLAVLTGLLFINGQALQEGKTLWGMLCGILSAVMYAVLVIFNKKVTHITGAEKSMWQIIFSFSVVAAFLLGRRGLPIPVPEGSWPFVLLLGCLTGVGCYFYLSSMGRLSVQTVAICGYLEPLGAVVLSAVLLGESMAPMQMAGAALILGGAMYAELAGKRERKEEKAKKIEGYIRI